MCNVPTALADADAAFISFADKPLFSMTIPVKFLSCMSFGMRIIAVVEGQGRSLRRRSADFVVMPETYLHSKTLL